MARTVENHNSRNGVNYPISDSYTRSKVKETT